MRFSRWIDHFPPWLAWGALTSTGIYEPFELVFMALPLLAAALVEWRRWGLGRWRRVLEILALAIFLALLLARIGLIPTLIDMLFVLSGIRLALPRELAQRRQLLLMGFLIWITTAISTFEIDFLIWSLGWVAGSSLVLLQLSWEGSAHLRRGTPQPPPYHRVWRWSGAALLLAAGFFLIMPRVTLGLRSFPWGVAGLSAARAGLSDTLDLGDRGSILPSNEAALRILPSASSESDIKRQAEALALLKGVTLETLEGQRWKPDSGTPPRIRQIREIATIAESGGNHGMDLYFFIAPNPQGILPLPYGALVLEPPPGMPIREGLGGSLRWMIPSRRAIPIRVRVIPLENSEEEPPPRRSRWERLTSTGVGTESLDRWSRTIVADELPAKDLAERLTSELRTFIYSLDNPSGQAKNPLQDFIERTHAGHCEYYASSLAVMLRYRGIPARVVNGYRLGPWIAEGGYWLVTGNEAHSWVEYYDTTLPGWRVADPTPAAPPSKLDKGTFTAAMQRWMDALRYRWDRHVVRFSGEDQMAGMDWFQAKVPALLHRFGKRETALAGFAILILWVWRWIWKHPGMLHKVHQDRRAGHPYRITALKPLVRKAGKAHPPLPGETARAWLMRLARLQSEQRNALFTLAELTDQVCYGCGSRKKLKQCAREVARAWKN